MADPVVIADYDPSWPATFEQLRDRLTGTLGLLAVAIEHVGSTAVPGLAAKPIIDLDVVIADRADLPAVIQQLRPLGYQHEGDLGVPGREAFTTPAGPPHHLYVCALGTPRTRPAPGPPRRSARRLGSGRRLRPPETNPGRPARP